MFFDDEPTNAPTDGGMTDTEPTTEGAMPEGEEKEEGGEQV